MSNGKRNLVTEVNNFVYSQDEKVNKLTIAEKFFLICLARKDGPKGIIPGIGLLASEMRCSIRQIQRLVKSLEQKKHIIKEIRRRGGYKFTIVNCSISATSSSLSATYSSFPDDQMVASSDEMVALNDQMVASSDEMVAIYNKNNNKRLIREKELRDERGVGPPSLVNVLKNKKTDEKLYKNHSEVQQKLIGDYLINIQKEKKNGF